MERTSILAPLLRLSEDTRVVVIFVKRMLRVRITVKHCRIFRILYLSTILAEHSTQQYYKFVEKVLSTPPPTGGAQRGLSSLFKNSCK